MDDSVWSETGPLEAFPGPTPKVWASQLGRESEFLTKWSRQSEAWASLEASENLRVLQNDVDICCT